MTLAATQVSPLEARQEVGRILLAQDDLAYFAEYVSNGLYTAHAMHRLMAREIQQVIRYLQTDGAEGTQFLMILTAPQHGKSTLVSRYTPAWALGKLPNLRNILVSYGADLATGHSRAVRNMLRSARYQAVFGAYSPSDEPVELAADSTAAAAWNLAEPHQGGMIAAGVDGAVSGQAKGLGIFDDPIKGEKEAKSQEVRDQAWDFYISSLRVRMRAGLFVTTRWHPDDPAGRIIRDMVTKPHGDQWRILMLPGITEEGMFAKDEEDQRKRMLDGVYLPLRDPLGRGLGQVLCPEMLSKSEMLKIREAQGEYHFAALYLQMPFAKEGQKYKKEWFKTVTVLPESVKIVHAVRYWDKANSAGGDYTAGVLMAYCSDGFFYILDVVRVQATSYERDQKMLKTAESDKTLYGKVNIWHQQDPGSAGKDSAENTNKLFLGFPAKFEPLSGSKEDRSEPLESGFQGGLVKLVKGVWNEAFTDECVAFPRGKYDDQVDAASSAYNKLCEMIRKHRESRIWIGSANS